MKKHLILILFISCFTFVIAQEISLHNYAESVYDKDIDLYKGTVHNEYPKTSRGHKYLFTSDNTIGSVNVQGMVYDSLQLRYDIYLQSLVLEYVYYPIEKRYVSSLAGEGRDYSKASYKIDLNPAFIDGFTLGKHQFVPIGKTNISYPYQYLQIIPSKTLECYIAWRKEYLIEDIEMYFSEERRKVYLKIDDKHVRVSSKKTIIKKLPAPIRSEVKKYCKTVKFSTKKSDINEFYTLFALIDDLMNNYEN